MIIGGFTMKKALLILLSFVLIYSCSISMAEEDERSLGKLKDSRTPTIEDTIKLDNFIPIFMKNNWKDYIKYEDDGYSNHVISNIKYGVVDVFEKGTVYSFNVNYVFTEYNKVGKMLSNGIYLQKTLLIFNNDGEFVDWFSSASYLVEELPLKSGA